MAYIIELDENDMELLNNGQRVVARFNNGVRVEIVGVKTKKDYATYTDDVIMGLEAKYGKGNF